MSLVFVVEDNENLREAVISYLKLEGLHVKEFSKVKDVFDSVGKLSPDLIVLDVMLPDGDGFQLAKLIRQKFTVPIIFLTAKNSESNRINGFEIGCDDYIVKPFSPRELVLRVKVILKRSQPDSIYTQSNSWTIDSSRLMINRESHTVSINEKQLGLTATEWKILDYLTTSTGIIVDRQKLLSVCLDYNFDMSERTIITHIKNLRSKLGDLTWIETVRGFGYRFLGNPE